MERVLKSRYKIGQVISETGFCSTYQGEGLATGELVLIKIYRRSFLDNFLIQKLADKVKNISTLLDPHIARLLDGDYGWQGFFFIREYVEGSNLAQVLKNKKVLEIDQILSVAFSLCRALHAAHEKGIVHGNLTPQNIIITPEGFAKVTDFGIDNSIKGSYQQRARSVLHNPFYLAPEQIQGRESTRYSDIYNVGTMLYLMLTGNLPYKNGSPLTVALKKIKEVPLPPTSLNPKIPSYLEEITLKAMEIDPLLRFETVEEMKNCLTEKAILVRTAELGLASSRYAGISINTSQMGAASYRQSEDLEEGRRFRIQFPTDSEMKKKVTAFLYLSFGVISALLLGYGLMKLILR